MHYLLGTESVHATASICDYLDGRTGPDDVVTAVGVAAPGDDTACRDVREALNVAPVRLATVDDVRTEFRETTRAPAAVLREIAAAADVDEIVVTAGGDTAAVGSTTRSLLEEPSWPTVVVPDPDL